jgi:hypothetical protein
MSITITTLNNEAAVAKTFTEISKDRSVGEWINSTDSTSTLDGRLLIKQQVIGKTKTGVPIRRSLVQSKFVAPTTVVLGGNSVVVPEEVTVNLTITTPTALATLTATQRKDLVAFVRNFITAANVDKLANGEN